MSESTKNDKIRRNGGRPKRIGEVVKIQITTNQTLALYLDRLAKTGLYGSSRAECAERLMCEGLAQAFREKVLLRKPISLES